MLARGADNRAIAEALAISPDTARTHIQNLLGKLGLHSRLEAAAFAVRGGSRGPLQVGRACERDGNARVIQWYPSRDVCEPEPADQLVSSSRADPSSVSSRRHPSSPMDQPHVAIGGSALRGCLSSERGHVHQLRGPSFVCDVASESE